MPNMLLEIPEVVESISRPVVTAVTDDLVKWLRLKDKPPMVFLGGSNQPPNPKGFGMEGAKFNVFNSEARIFIEVNEEYPEYAASTAIQQKPDNIVEFHDAALGVYLKPIYQPVRVNVEFRIRTSDRSTAEQIRQSWKRLAAAAKEAYFHTVSYHYPIPLEQLAVLLEIHKAREATAGYGETFPTWLKKCFSEKMTVITDQAGKNPIFVIKENQTGIMGWYDFNAEPPKFDKDAEGGSWTTTVNYQFQYDRVEGVAMHYPIMVHNTILPLKLFDTRKPEELDDIKNYRNLSGHLFEYFERMNKPGSWHGEPGLSIPHFDDWIQETRYPNTQCLTRILLGVDPDNRNLVLNLNEIGDWSLDPMLVEHMRAMGDGIFYPNQALVHVTLCEGQRIMDFQWMSLNNNLDIMCSQDLQLRKVYHLNIAFNYNLPALSEKAITDLIAHGALLRKAILLIDPDIESKGYSLALLPDGSMPFYAAKAAMNAAFSRAWTSNTPDIGTRRTVGQFLINSLRES